MPTLQRKTEKKTNRASMSDFKDAELLAELLTEQREASKALAATRIQEERQRLERKVNKIRRQCIEVVDVYFRKALRPVLAQRFPQKGLQAPPNNQDVYSNDAIARYTELINDFFVQVLSMSDDEFWRRKTVIELRNYASIAISRDMIDVIRRRRKQEPLDDDVIHSTFEDQLAAEVEQRFVADKLTLEPADALHKVDEWERSSDEESRTLAALIRHKYVSGMTMDQIADDLGVSKATAYRLHKEAIARLSTMISR